MRLLLFLLLAGLVAIPGASRAQPTLAVDLSSHMVPIAADFAGTKLLLYGTADPGSDVVVVVRGPSVSRTMRRKAQIGGIWVNRDAMRFGYVPSFYAVASSRPLAEIATPEVLKVHGIGIGNIDLPGPSDVAESNQIPFRIALIRIMEREGLYATEPAPVRFQSGSPLFRTNIGFPANAPVGPYHVRILQFQDGGVINMTHTPLVVSRVGFAAGVFELAHRNGLLYGVIAILIAGVAGWLANAAFKRS